MEGAGHKLDCDLFIYILHDRKDMFSSYFYFVVKKNDV